MRSHVGVLEARIELYRQMPRDIGRGTVVAFSFELLCRANVGLGALTAMLVTVFSTRSTVFDAGYGVNLNRCATQCRRKQSKFSTMLHETPA